MTGARRAALRSPSNGRISADLITWPIEFGTQDRRSGAGFSAFGICLASHAADPKSLPWERTARRAPSERRAWGSNRPWEEPAASSLGRTPSPSAPSMPWRPVQHRGTGGQGPLIRRMPARRHAALRPPGSAFLQHYRTGQAWPGIFLFCSIAVTLISRNTPGVQGYARAANGDLIDDTGGRSGAARRAGVAKVQGPTDPGRPHHVDTSRQGARSVIPVTRKDSEVAAGSAPPARKAVGVEVADARDPGPGLPAPRLAATDHG